MNQENAPSEPSSKEEAPESRPVPAGLPVHRAVLSPRARAALLNTASKALTRQPWPAVHMVDVATAAGVSRQSLYNEFGTKDGLARALVRREADAYLAGVDRALATPGDAGQRLATTAEWTVAPARGNPLAHALLTGCWTEKLPTPTLAAVPHPSCASPAQRHADGPLPSPAELVALVRDRAVTALTVPDAPRCDTAMLARSCEPVVRLALSCVTAPPDDGGITDLVHAVLHRDADAERIRALADGL